MNHRQQTVIICLFPIGKDSQVGLLRQRIQLNLRCFISSQSNQPLSGLARHAVDEGCNDLVDK